MGTNNWKIRKLPQVTNLTTQDKNPVISAASASVTSTSALNAIDTLFSIFEEDAFDFQDILYLRKILTNYTNIAAELRKQQHITDYLRA